ncbi:MAG: DoxX family protein [Verrucomicrobia bacterium]|nr:DoxX family protein [Verrucomicrobiota bacterium]
MSDLPLTGKRRLIDIATLVIRWLLGGFFIYLGLSKVLHPAEFLTFIRQQLLIGDPFLSGLIATTAPWLEVFYGLLLLSGIAQGFAVLLARWWLGCVFIYMGLHKALPHPEYFLKLVRQYDMVSSAVLLNMIGAALPWFEVYCGVLLLAGVAVRGSAMMLIAMLVPFTLIVLKRALSIAAVTGKPLCAVKFDCGCGAGEVFICHKLVENTVLLLLSAWLLAGCGRQFCLWFSLFRDKAPVLQQHEPSVPPAV